MDLLIAFFTFLASVVVCLVKGLGLYWALLVGFFCFFLVGLRRGFPAKNLWAMAGRGGVTALSVMWIMVLIGLLTALWRASGTISFFVHTGIQLITPRSFILVAFLLPAVLCLAFGSSFGVCGTAGVILMAIARSGDANLAVTAGAILSGAYVGERLSPASSSVALVAAVGGVDQRQLQRRLWRNTPLPMGLTLLFFGGLSLLLPIQSVDTQILTALESDLLLTWPTLLPALVLVLLPWFHVSAKHAIAASCALAAGVAVVVQGMPLDQLLRTCIFGYTAQQPQLAGILSGGGALSMLSVVLVILCSCAYSGLFTGTGMLAPYQEKVRAVAQRIGVMPTHILLSLLCGSVFCNQSASIVMGAEMLKNHYRQEGRSDLELATDIGDATLNLVGIIPWSIACSVPLATIGGSLAAIPFAVYLYLVPLCRLVTDRRKNKVAPVG